MFDNTTRRNQWLDVDQVPIEVAKQHIFVKKAMLCVWWNTRGVVHYEVLDAGNNVDSTLYCQQLERVNQALTRQGIEPFTTLLSTKAPGALQRTFKHGPRISPNIHSMNVHGT